VNLKKLNWTFPNINPRYGRHKLHSYPATMHSSYVKAVLDYYSPKQVLDPFGGSGTVALECARQQILVYSNDLNPLVRPIALAKLEVYPKNYDEVVENVINKIRDKQLKHHKVLSNASTLFPRNEKGQEESEQDDILFRELDKLDSGIKFPRFKKIAYWFRPEIILGLQIIKECLPDISFFNVCFSECIRMVSNKRPGEFKMFRRPVTDLLNYKPNAFLTFEKVVRRNCQLVMDDVIPECAYKITGDDARDLSSIPDNAFDLIITSPPYGDSKTTVAYGQFSRLSLQWIDPKCEANQIDNILLGGNDSGKNVLFGSIKEIVDLLNKTDTKRASDVAGFFSDLEQSFRSIDKKTCKKGHHVWVTGNRMVRGNRIPLDLFIKEVGEKYGYEWEDTFYRDISWKAMPSQNSPTNKSGATSDTMSKESIVILRKK
jgi:site-specific DNA-methyltransferase (cytosine-N4-specific)